ncbi:transglutaminase-like putative cysteine protease [Propionicimonas paludicola]|uniref:Transglutaminase-like putative cysteine protease n=1 Tax=Propionicimonas paludicola TaxID=185243 RepID=A0A2A9CVY5_9ACTN|nr:transglutaminase family protein [Propionicimonas paludicola]PFG18306.1 transglutaminase-like putative cysteine protease [Propionicimonas paludicola]
MSTPDVRRYRITHRTSYRYDDVLEAGYNRGLLRPRETATQQVLSFELTSTPAAEQLSEHLDYFGNPSLYLETRAPVTELVVEAVSQVQVSWPAPDLAALDAWSVAEAAAVLAAELDPVEHTEFTWPSPLVAIDAGLGEYAAQVLGPDRPLGTALAELLHAIHRDFRYTTGATSVQTTLAEVLATRQGVCQDFAQLTVGCLRWAGLPARYVSGYLETVPPPGRPKLRGADATHAWASVRCPDGSWVDLDPTNDQFADSRYIVTAWGRDYSDVSPLRGVVFTEADSSTLSVEVDVEPC